MRCLADLIASIMETMKTIWTPVYRAGRWTLEASTAIVATPLRAAGSAIAWTADAAIEVAMAPVKMLGNALRGGVGAASGPGVQAAASAQQATQRAEAVVSQGKATTSAIEVAKILSRAARFRVQGHDTAPLLEELPHNLAAYLRKLTDAECKVLGDMELGHLVGLVADAKPLPGIRSMSEAMVVREHVRVVAEPYASDIEIEVLNSLRDRLLARARENNDASVPGRQMA